MNRRKMMMKVAPVQLQEGKKHYAMYIYDDVSAYGEFDWSSWTYIESETSADYFRQQLAEIPEDAVIDLYINSYGGEVKEGTSIYNQLKRHPAQKVGYVDGMAYSVAFLILQACDKRIMNLGTTCLAHNMLMGVYGNATDLRKAADDLDAMMVSNRQIFLTRSGGKITEEKLMEIMEQEKILTPEECLEYGFVDEVSDKEVQQDPDPQQKMSGMIQEFYQQMGNATKQMQDLRNIVQKMQKDIEISKVPEQKNNPEHETGVKDQQNICQSFFNAILNS